MPARRLAALACLLCATRAHGAEMCTQPKLTQVPADHPQCLFYSGTEKYRTGDYAGAGLLWQKLVALKDLPPEFVELKTIAYNNLGFLHYMGWGVAVDRPMAIDYWKHAAIMGEEEATYHLCHVYGQRKNPEFDLDYALEYCREALKRYAKHKDLDESRDEVVDQIKDILRTISPKPSRVQQ